MALLYIIPFLSNRNSDPLRFSNQDALPIHEPVQDHFDRLPDPVLLLILNRVHDAKSLDNCYIVSRRFQSLIPLVDQLYVKIDRVITVQSSATTNEIPSRSGGIFSHLSCALQTISQRLAPFPFKNIIASISDSGASKSVIPLLKPFVVLRKFKEVKNLIMELPGIKSCLEDGLRFSVQMNGGFLKWKARFGTTLENCAIFCAPRVYENSPNPSHIPNPNPSPNPNSEETISNGDLKLRFEWMQSSLIAASVRHYFLRNIIYGHETLERLIFTDEDNQGVLTMDDKQLKGFRIRPVSASSGPFRRTVLPAVSIKFWYANYLDVPDGMKFEGATLMAIQPSDVADLGDDWVLDAFDEPYKSAVQMILERYNYRLFEMNSF